MNIARAFLALVAGFLTMAVLVGVITALLVKLAPGFVGEHGHPRRSYILVNMLYSFFASVAGGYVTAQMGSENPLVHILVLAVVILLLSGASAVQQRGRQPLAYQLALVVLSPVGVMAGGLLQLKVHGLL